MAAIFISYRREDSSALVTRLVDDLSARLAGARLFTSAEALRPGEDFDAGIARLLDGCDGLIVVIGQNWLNARAADGHRLLDDPDDRARRELGLALARHLPVLPVLTQGARLPPASDLPEDIRRLAALNPQVLNEQDWERGMETLERAMASLLGLSSAPAMSAPQTAQEEGLFGRALKGLQGIFGKNDADEEIGVSRERPSATGPQSHSSHSHSSHSTSRSARREEVPRMAEAAQPPDWESLASAASASAPDTQAEATPAPPAIPAVHLGASAPRAARPGDEFTARFVAYVAERETAVRDMLARLSPRNESHLGLKTCQWKAGERFAARLVAKGLEVSPAEEEFVWDGEQVLVEFDVAVPESAPLGVVVLKFDVLSNGITVARLRLDLDIAAQADPVASEASGCAAHSAFASYSSKDRDRVLDRVDAARIAAGLDIFVDCLSLHPGEQWKQALEREIPARDLFMLFWSEEAAKSPWVDWEWRRALALKGLDAMQIHPLENGVKPPPELGALHFGSVAMYARRPEGG